MKNILELNKRGISEIVSYVLMIVVVIGLSVAVGSYLRLQVPKDKFVCSEDISILIDQISCLTGVDGEKTSITVSYKNTGLFTIDAVYARIGKEERRVKTLINDPNNPEIQPSEAYKRFYFVESEEEIEYGLKPGQTLQHFYETSEIIESGDYEFEVQPAVVEQGVLSICQNIVKQKITCV